MCITKLHAYNNGSFVINFQEFTLVWEHACFTDEPVYVKCKPVPGAKSCVCEHPDGIIDLTKIANSDGTPR